MADRMIFQKKWYESLMEDEYSDITDQEMAYILYAAMMYSFEGGRTDLGATFGEEFKSLNRVMPNIYSQIDNIENYNNKFQGKNQKYDNEAIKALAAEGYTQKEICLKLGYDPAKSRSLSSNRGYIEGRAAAAGK